MKNTFLLFSAVVLIVYDICAQNVNEGTASPLNTAGNATVSDIRSSAAAAGPPVATPAQNYPEEYARLLKNTFRRRRPWRGSPLYSARRFRGGTSYDRTLNVDYDIATPNYNPRADSGYPQYHYPQPQQQQQQQPPEGYQSQYQQQVPLYNHQQQQARGAYPPDYQQYPSNYQYPPYLPQQQYQQQQYPQQPQYPQQSAYQPQQYPPSQYSQPQDVQSQQQTPVQQPPYPQQPQQQQPNTAYQQQPYNEAQQQYQQPQYQQPYQTYQQPQQYQYPQQPPPAGQQYQQRDDVQEHRNYLPYTAQHYPSQSGDLGEPKVFYPHYPPGRMAEDFYRKQNLTYEHYPYINPFYRNLPRRRFRSRGRSSRSFFSYNPPTIPRQAKDSKYWGTNQFSGLVVTELSHTYKDLIEKFSGSNYLKQVKEKAKGGQILHIHTGANFTRTTKLPTTQATTTLQTTEN